MTPLIGLVGNTEYSVSYESAISFGVSNPTFLKGLEGLQSVGEDGVKEGIGWVGAVGKLYEKAKC